MTFDDTQEPPRINKVVQTRRPPPKVGLTRNIAPRARASSANATPIQYWIAAVNDGKNPSNPLPPEYWSSYAGENSPQNSTLTLTWNATVSLNGTRMILFADQPEAENIGVPPPASWSMEYLADDGSWVGIDSTYPTTITEDPAEIEFAQVDTKSVRALLVASGINGQFGGVAVKEWEVLATRAS
ncbi:hypothetical protein EKO04_008618 [Ascochyta lentis]|uniref:F5/8 type C domain-containing protein n=1 Tax=Ascochyta lentis TaxID=205686 RepID=A0A8H7MHD7_9PLEO|nr:hypothetical protein EKO04_008618 [Ascochyta lentis]